MPLFPTTFGTCCSWYTTFALKCGGFLWIPCVRLMESRRRASVRRRNRVHIHQREREDITDVNVLRNTQLRQRIGSHTRVQLELHQVHSDLSGHQRGFEHVG